MGNDQITPAPTSDLETDLPMETITLVARTNQADGETHYGYPSHRADGNRYVSGRGALPISEPLDITLAGKPVWLAAAPSGDIGFWVAALEDGRLQAFKVSAAGKVEKIEVTTERLSSGMPPLLQVTKGKLQVVVPSGSDFSPLTYPVALGPTEGDWAYVAIGGDVVIQKGGQTTRLEVDALPDARLLIDEAGRILLLSGATDRYDHGVLGDGIEASEITLIETLPTPRISMSIPVPEPSVVEGIAPIWADLSGNGVREIIVTLSDRTRGARLVVFNQEGKRIATGPDIGQGYRWRNQMAVGAFGPQGSLELVDVLTPHLKGTVEFFQLAGDQLELVAQLSGYTSHVIGSRNLDMALSGDFDGDNRYEVLIPDQSLSRLNAIRHTENRAQVAWTLPSGGTISTNLAAIQFPQGDIALGIGREDNTLRIWGP
jgi:hypothetical protein